MSAKGRNISSGLNPTPHPLPCRTGHRGTKGYEDADRRRRSGHAGRRPRGRAGRRGLCLGDIRHRAAGAQRQFDRDTARQAQAGDGVCRASLRAGRCAGQCRGAGRAAGPADPGRPHQTRHPREAVGDRRCGRRCLGPADPAAPPSPDAGADRQRQAAHRLGRARAGYGQGGLLGRRRSRGAGQGHPLRGDRPQLCRPARR